METENAETKKVKSIEIKPLLENVKKEMVELTSLPFNTIIGVMENDETGTPKITVELVEKVAIPDSMDLIGVYEVILDNKCKIKSFKRIGMRKRGDIVSNDNY